MNKKCKLVSVLEIVDKVHAVLCCAVLCVLVISIDSVIQLKLKQNVRVGVIVRFIPVCVCCE